MSPRAHLCVLLVMAAGVALGVWALVDRGGREGGRAAPWAEADEPRPIAAVEEVLRSLGLITVRIRTTVTAESVDESWRGDVNARSIAPATLYYGCDLQVATAGGDSPALSVTRRAGGLFGDSEVRVRVPAPKLLAVEVDAEAESPNVRVTGFRFRDLSGEYHLGRARLGLWAAARRAALSPEQRQEVEAITREQVGALVRSVLGPMARVEVEFAPAGDAR